MDAHTRALAVDFALAAGATVVGALGVGGHPGWSVAIAGLGCIVLVGMVYLAEQTPLLALVEARRPASLALAVATTLSVGVVLVLGWRVVASPAATLLLGMGVGLAGYRVGFGVVGPLPEKRRLQASGSVASTFGEEP